MLFVQLYFNDERVIVFNPRSVSIVSGANNDTRIIFADSEHDPVDFKYDINEFCQKVFSPDDTEIESKIEGVQIVQISEDEDYDTPIGPDEPIDDPLGLLGD